MEAKKYLEELSTRVLKATDEYSKFSKALELFPDLVVHKDRWETIRCGAQSANQQVDQVEIRHSCGCCRDAALLIGPHMILQNGEKVYSDPVQFNVGNENEWGYGEVERAGWEEEMKTAGINPKVIAQVRAYLDDHKPEPYEDDEEF